jgi:hypothetical protein
MGDESEVGRTSLTSTNSHIQYRKTARTFFRKAKSANSKITIKTTD